MPVALPSFLQGLPRVLRDGLSASDESGEAAFGRDDPFADVLLLPSRLILRTPPPAHGSRGNAKRRPGRRRARSG